MQIGEHSLSFSKHKNPSKVDWQAYGVDIVLECSGKFRTTELLQPFPAGVSWGHNFPKALNQAQVAATKQGARWIWC